MKLPPLYWTLHDAVSSYLASARNRVFDTVSDGRIVGKAFFWYVWFMIVMATMSTLALWITLDANYGKSRVLTRSPRDSSETLGLLDSLHSVFGKFDSIFNRGTYVDVISKRLSLGSVCPEIDIPGSEKNVTHKLNETAMHHVEEYIFRMQTVNVRKLTSIANKKVQRLYKEHQYKATTSTVEDILTFGIDMDHYLFLPGGHWIPATCAPRWKVAIIVPFRDRFYHLPILLRHLVPFLKSQYLEFGIFVVEQANGLRFNRAMLMNVGFFEALNFTTFDCFIFHDVDHVPLSYGNYYGCSAMPRHFLSGVDRWNYRLLYGAFFGAVTGFTRTQIEKFNGFPNVYWGWGGEDDDILGRIRAKGLAKTRPWGPVGYYNVIPHHHKSAKKNMDRVCLLTHFKERTASDGLNNLYYGTPQVELLPLYTNISVDIQELPWNMEWHACDRATEEAQANAERREQLGIGQHKLAPLRDFVDPKMKNNAKQSDEKQNNDEIKRNNDEAR